MSTRAAIELPTCGGGVENDGDADGVTSVDARFRIVGLPGDRFFITLDPYFVGVL